MDGSGQGLGEIRALRGTPGCRQVEILYTWERKAVGVMAGGRGVVPGLPQGYLPRHITSVYLPPYLSGVSMGLWL